MGGFGIMSDIFMPGRRFQEEEENRLEWTRDEEGQGDPHRGPIDLAGGKVVIRLSPPPAEPE